MAHIVITAIGSAGDVHPFVSIGRALAARGHRIVFCTHPPFEPLATNAGFAFVPIGTAPEYEAAIANPALWNPRTSFRVLWSVIAPTIRSHFDVLASLATRDTLLVGSLWALSARLMQEVHGTPYVSVQVSPSTLLSADAPPTHPRMTIPAWLPRVARASLMDLLETKLLDRALGPVLNGVRTELGLAPADHILGTWLHSTDGVLCLFPEWFAPPQSDWPRNRAMCGFPLAHDERADDAPDREPDRELERFLSSGPPPVVFTAGSTLLDERAWFGSIEHTLQRTKTRAIVIARNAAIAFSGQPQVLARSFVPLGTLLPRCAAIVHHGGIGTAALAFASGIPQVVTPFAHDQFDNAARVARIGCGVQLKALASGDALAAAIDHVSRDRVIAIRCEEAKRRLQRAPDACIEAARYIERFVPHHEKVSA